MNKKHVYSSMAREYDLHSNRSQLVPIKVKSGSTFVKLSIGNFWVLFQLFRLYVDSDLGTLR